MSHLKNNYIFGILESRPTIWHTFKQISSTFNFWPPYNPMGSFWSPVFQNAQWCQSGISLFACQDMSKSQKQQKYCNYTRLPSPKFILLFVNSTNWRIPFYELWPSTSPRNAYKKVQWNCSCYEAWIQYVDYSLQIRPHHSNVWNSLLCPF